MTPFRTLFLLLSIFALLGVLSFGFPGDGISMGRFTLRFPSLKEKLEETKGNLSDAPKPDPEAQIQKMLAETRAREFAEYADSLAFYESFFKDGPTRFDFPDENPTWFDRFFDRVLQAKDSGEVVHIVHYGDSQLEGDRITATFREALQSLFGGSGPGMVPPLADIPSFVFNGHSTGNLARHRIFGPAEEHAPNNKYGPLAQVTELNGSATFSFKKSLHLKNFPNAGKFQKVRLLASKANLKTKLIYKATVTDTLLNDSVPEYKSRIQKFLATAPKIETFPNLSVYTWDLLHETESITLTVSGRASLYTIVLDGASGVGVDNVAMRGSSGTVFTKMDNALLGASLKAINAKLILMEYGGNLVPSVTRANLGWVEKTLERQIQALQKAVPEADILFIGPADMSKKINGKWTSYPNLEMTVEKIREVALKNGCAYWDMYRVMGGKDAMISWVKEKPPLGGPDYIHFTRAGASRIGELLYNAIKLHYDYYTFRKTRKIDSEKLFEIRSFRDSAESKADTLVTENDTLILLPISDATSDSAEKKPDTLQGETR